MTQRTYTTPRGNPVQFHYREDTNDGALISALLDSDEYRLASLPVLTGWALDVGAHVGSVGLALAVDHPNLNVVCVEPVPDNAELIRASIAANLLGDRVFVEEAGAGCLGMTSTRCMYDFTSAAPSVDAGYLHDTRYVGNVVRGDENPVGTVIEAPVVTITGLAEKYGADEFCFTKIDCEGCEWQFLASGTRLLQHIIGEWHDNPPSAIVGLLRGTHDVTILDDKGGVGLFRAVRR